MNRTHLGVPRVQRLDYLVAFLESCGGDEFDEKQAQRAIQQKIYYFEVEKASALGRQRPRTPKGTSTLRECRKMSSHLRLIDRFNRLTPDAAEVLDPNQRMAFLSERMWQVYPRFRQLVLAVRDAERMDLPMYESEDAFRQAAGSRYNLEFDSLTFETIRDLATQLGFINWYPTEQRDQSVYPVASVVTYVEIACLVGCSVENDTFAQQCRHQTAIDLNLLVVRDGRYEANMHIDVMNQGYIVLQTESDRVFIKNRVVAPEDLEQVLWREYLGLSKMRSRFPVLYPELRNKVCAALRISDQSFNQHILSLILRPQRLNIYPSGGVLNYAANLAHLGKFLPPKTAQGNFIIYLKIERKGA
jgi:hypothetical protein